MMDLRLMQAYSTQRSTYQPEGYLPAQGVKTVGEECDALPLSGAVIGGFRMHFGAQVWTARR